MVIIRQVTGITIRWCVFIPIGMTVDTVYGLMRTRQWKCRFVVIECAFCIAGGVTSQTRAVFIHIPIDPIMLCIGLSIHVAGHTGIDCIIIGVGVTIAALTPGALVSTTIYREILHIMVSICCG